MTYRPSDVNSPNAWLDAYQENQKQIVNAHETFQRTLTQGFEAFMHAMTHSQTQLARVMEHMGQDSSSAHAVTPTPNIARPTARPLTRASKSPANLEMLLLNMVAKKTGYPVETLELDMSLEDDLGVDSIKRVEILSTLRDEHPELPEVGADVMASIETLHDVLSHLRHAQTHSSAPTTPHVPTQPSAQPPANFDTLLLDVVAQKTGYPVETLELDMSLEDDLGVDSIKRVEILSTLRDLLPNLPEADADRMSTLETLSDIVTFLKTSVP